MRTMVSVYIISIVVVCSVGRAVFSVALLLTTQLVKIRSEIQTRYEQVKR